MPGASQETRRVKNINVNWIPADAADDGQFEVMIVTEDDSGTLSLPVLRP